MEGGSSRVSRTSFPTKVGIHCGHNTTLCRTENLDLAKIVVGMMTKPAARSISLTPLIAKRLRSLLLAAAHSAIVLNR